MGIEMAPRALELIRQAERRAAAAKAFGPKRTLHAGNVHLEELEERPALDVRRLLRIQEPEVHVKWRREKTMRRRVRLAVVLFISALMLPSASQAASEPGPVTDAAVNALDAFFGVLPGASAAPLPMIDVCHKPEGANPISINVSAAAWPAHEAHGDLLGVCVGGDDDGDGDGGDSGDGDAPDGNQTDDPDHDLVALCHDGTSLSVDDEAASAHLAHGDSLGECADGDGTGDPSGNQTDAPGGNETDGPGGNSTDDAQDGGSGGGGGSGGSGGGGGSSGGSGDSSSDAAGDGDSGDGPDAPDAPEPLEANVGAPGDDRHGGAAPSWPPGILTEGGLGAEGGLGLPDVADFLQATTSSSSKKTENRPSQH